MHWNWGNSPWWIFSDGRLRDFFKKVWNYEKCIKRKFLTTLWTNLKPIFLVPWDHIRVHGYPFRDPRVPIYSENMVSPIIYYTLVINLRVYYIFSKDSDFFGPRSQFWYINYFHVAGDCTILFCFSIRFMFRL